MRTTLTLDDGLFRDLKELAHRKRVPFRRVVDQVLRAGIDAAQRPPPKGRVRVRTFSMGAPRLSLDRALELAASLEDEAISRKFRLRK